MPPEEPKPAKIVDIQSKHIPQELENEVRVAADLALKINNLDTSHGILNAIEGPKWAAEMRNLITQIEDLINSLDNSKFLRYIQCVPYLYSEQQTDIILFEWSQYRLNALGRMMKNFSKKAKVDETKN